MTLASYIKILEEIIGSSSIVLSSNINKFFGPAADTVFLKGSVLFMNSSVLDFALFLVETQESVLAEKYRLQYMDKHGALIFRYDNAPHHPLLQNFPHHKHTPVLVENSRAPSLQGIFNEISCIMLAQGD